MSILQPRPAWDTPDLRRKAQAVLAILGSLADTDITLPPALWRSWRLERMARRYPAILQALDSLKSLPDLTYRPTAQPGAQYAPAYAGMSEAQAERQERCWRAAHFIHMTESAREAHARAHPIGGNLSRAAEREGHAIRRLAILKRQGLELIALGLAWKGEPFLTRRPRSGWSPPDSPYLKIRRYPRQKAIRAWLKILAGGRTRREITTAQDRERRRVQRVARATFRAAAEMAQNPEGLARLKALVAAIEAAQIG